jgi:hypothetical protein
MTTKPATAALLIAIMITANGTDCSAQYEATVSKSKAQGVKGYLNSHPKVKGATIGAGVGAGAGAITGLISGKGTLRGAGIGAATGAGVGVVRTSKTMKKHPVLKDTATGALIGTGLGLAATRGRGKGKKTATAAGVGAALGLGVGLFKDKLK